MANPWAHSRTENEFDEPDYPVAESARFAVPDIDEDAPYTDTFGWSPTLRVSAQEIPDNARMGTRPLRDFRPNPQRAPEEFWDRIYEADEAPRHRVEYQDADGWNEEKGVTGNDRRWAPNPRSTPPPENRVTQQLSPSTYRFTRPFGWGLPKFTAKAFTGEHFSMADHRRDYEIGGMAPASSRRNTWRIEPTPLDVNVVDVPPNVEPETPSGRIQSVEVIPTGTRNWRLT